MIGRVAGRALCLGRGDEEGLGGTEHAGRFPGIRRRLHGRRRDRVPGRPARGLPERCGSARGPGREPSGSGGRARARSAGGGDRARGALRGRGRGSAREPGAPRSNSGVPDARRGRAVRGRRVFPRPPDRGSLLGRAKAARRRHAAGPDRLRCRWRARRGDPRHAAAHEPQDRGVRALERRDRGPDRESSRSRSATIGRRRPSPAEIRATQPWPAGCVGQGDPMPTIEELLAAARSLARSLGARAMRSPPARDHGRHDRHRSSTGLEYPLRSTVGKAGGPTATTTSTRAR